MSDLGRRSGELAALSTEVGAARAAWAAARDQLYQWFKDVPRPSRIEGCSHCVPVDADLPLLTGPVSRLPPEVLAPYAFKAITTWGDADDLRYFAPRLVECVVADAAEFPAAETVLGKLARADWLGWAPEQVDAIHRSLLAWWQLTLAGDGAGDADTVLCAVAATGTDLTDHLARWSRLSTEASTTLLLDLVTTSAEWTPPPRMRNPFWRHLPQQERQLLQWLTHGDAAHAVAEAFDRTEDDTVLERLAALHTWVAPT